MINEIEHPTQLFTNSKADTILREVKMIYSYHYTQNSFVPLSNCFVRIYKLYNGNYSGYNACNTEYHNFKHILDVLLITIKLIDGFNLKKYIFPQEVTCSMIYAALFHDTGYIQESWDNDGLGAKYTFNHVDRSIIFLKNHYHNFHVNNNIEKIERIIRGTNLGVDFDSISFETDEEKIASAILGTADLLSQMANRSYLEKLIFLYYKFREANIPDFNSKYDILKKTYDYYEFIKKRLDDSLMGLYSYADCYFQERMNINKNLYIESINKNITYLKQIIEDENNNFVKSIMKKMDK